MEYKFLCLYKVGVSNVYKGFVRSLIFCMYRREEGVRDVLVLLKIFNFSLIGGKY